MGNITIHPLKERITAKKYSSILSSHPGLSMDSSFVIFSVQSDKHVVKTNVIVIWDNKRHCLNYQNNDHDKLNIVVCSILST